MFYNLDLPHERKLQEKIAHKRLYEEERKKRIFNPKERIYGKDYETLRKQLEEKMRLNEKDERLKKSQNEEIMRQAKLAQEIEMNLQKNQKEIEKNLKEFRKNYQKFEDRREFDLNDPDCLKKCKPVINDDGDNRAGPSSVQIFEGEDLNYDQRCLKSGMQRKSWLESQMNERKRLEQEKERAEKIHQGRMKQIEFNYQQLSEAEQLARQAVQKSLTNFNLAKAREDEERKILQKKRDFSAEIRHQENVMNSELLTEISDFNNTLPDRFKGFSEKQINEIREAQLIQMRAKMNEQMCEKKKEQNWEALKKKESLTGLLIEEDIEKRKKQKDLQIMQQNLELAREQQLRQEYLNKILYKNRPSEDFFNQFNTTTR